MIASRCCTCLIGGVHKSWLDGILESAGLRTEETVLSKEASKAHVGAKRRSVQAGCASAGGLSRQVKSVLFESDWNKTAGSKSRKAQLSSRRLSRKLQTGLC